MGYFEKQRKRIEAEKQLKEIMNTQAYRDMQKQLREESEANFGVVACEFLGLKHRYKSQGLAMKTDDQKRTCQCGKVIHVDAYKFCPYCGEELKGLCK